MKVVFMGTPDFAAYSLESIVNLHDVLCVVTQPDKPKGRGQKMQFTPVKEVAVKHNIEVLQPNKIKEEKEVIEYIKSLNPDVIVVVAYGQILSSEILNIPKYGCINVHASLLPSLRGAAPINWTIINGDSVTGVTIMQMDEGLDTGDMLLKSEITIGDSETAGELHDRLMNLGGNLLVEALDKIQDGNIKGEKQDNSISSYAHMMKKDLGHVNWNDDAKRIYNLIRGVIPWPGAYTYYNDLVIKIWSASYVSDDFNGDIGEIIKVDKEGILVKAKSGAILIKELQKIGGKRLDVASFLNGNTLASGEILK
ncbi:methionyl-tRNA formyltransferase [Clostridium cylindrosporum]|uniref:Methionyl-tRNA formyltransferase n=1 Tax=Clostridium cylindrosporum DSM 605 TaxID=1121307 RepID=A0A0J8G101_CLOCY|nr:methionyl-tRNA formyltransferase [Clostridium cylindrosporum]KMT21451.1 methionyl-tRNA formyltransferase Fmt [Clostridium cylindrosporum DSM 605]